jgi:predicted nucleic acid-binding protein
MNKIFLDTNIILDLVDKDRKHHTKIPKLLEVIVLKEIKVVISEDMLSTLFYVQKDKKLILKFLHTIQNKWSISSYGAKVINGALELAMQKQLDLEDVLQCLCAKENACTAIITNDKKFYDCGIDILSIDQFLERNNV